MKFLRYNFKKIPPQNSSYARDRTLCVYNLVFFFIYLFFFYFFFYEQKNWLIWHDIIALAHLNSNFIAWDHCSCLGLSMWAHHFKLKRHDLNHNPQTCKGDGLRDCPYYQATTLQWYNLVRDT